MKYSEDCLKILANSQIQVTVEDFIPVITRLNENSEEVSDMQFQCMLVTCLTETVKTTVEALNFPLLREIVFSITEREIKYEFDISPQSTNEDLCKQVSVISDDLNSLNTLKAEITHYLILLQHAANALESYVKPLNALFEIDAFLPKARFGTVKSKQASQNAVLTAVEAPLRQVKQYIKDLNSYLDNVVGSETNRLLRLESSIRLILNTRGRQSVFNGNLAIEGTGIDTL